MASEQAIRVTAKGDFAQLQRGLRQLKSDLSNVTGEINRGARKGGIFDDSQIRALELFGKRFRSTLQELRDGMQEQGHAFERLLSMARKASGAELDAINKEIKARKQSIDALEAQITATEQLYRNRQREAQQFRDNEKPEKAPRSGGGGGNNTSEERSSGGGLMRGIMGMGKFALALAGLSGVASLGQEAYKRAYTREVSSLDLSQRMRGQSGWAGSNTDMWDKSSAVGRSDRMGYSAEESFGFLDQYSRQAGNISSGDMGGLLKFGRGYGLSTSEVAGGVAGNRALGGTGSPKEFADAIAGSVGESGMTPRIIEVMDTNNTLLQQMNTTLKDGSAKQLLAYQTTLDKIGLDKGMMQLTGAQGANVIGGLGGIYKPGNDKWKWMGIRALQGYDKKKYGGMDLYGLESSFEDGLMNKDNIPAMAKYMKGISGGNKQLEKRMMQQWLTDGGFAATKTEAGQFYDATGGLTAFNADSMSKLTGVNSGAKYDASGRKDSAGQGILDRDARFEHAMETVGRPILSAVQGIKEGVTKGLETLLGDTSLMTGDLKSILEFLNKNLVGLGLDVSMLKLPQFIVNGLEAIFPNPNKQAYKDLYGEKAPDWLTTEDQLMVSSPTFFRKDKRWTGAKPAITDSMSADEKDNAYAMFEYLTQQDAKYKKQKAEEDKAKDLQDKLDRLDKNNKDHPTNLNNTGNGLASILEKLFNGSLFKPKDKGDSSIGGGSFFNGWQNRVTSRFGDTEGRTSPHRGLDIDGSQGDKLDALAGGKVSFIHMDDGGSLDADGKKNTRAGGTEVGVRMPNGKTYFYSHLSGVNPNMKVGGDVGAGDWIGNMGGDRGKPGSGADTTGSHLHLGYMDSSGKVMNPEELLNGLNKGDSSIGTVADGGPVTRSEITVKLALDGAGADAVNSATYAQLEALVRKIVTENERLKMSLAPSKAGWA